MEVSVSLRPIVNTVNIIGITLCLIGLMTCKPSKAVFDIRQLNSQLTPESQDKLKKLDNGQCLVELKTNFKKHISGQTNKTISLGNHQSPICLPISKQTQGKN